MWGGFLFIKTVVLLHVCITPLYVDGKLISAKQKPGDKVFAFETNASQRSYKNFIK
jgi:hypothetical protein